MAYAGLRRAPLSRQPLKGSLCIQLKYTLQPLLPCSPPSCPFTPIHARLITPPLHSQRISTWLLLKSHHPSIHSASPRGFCSNHTTPPFTGHLHVASAQITAWRAGRGRAALPRNHPPGRQGAGTLPRGPASADAGAGATGAAPRGGGPAPHVGAGALAYAAAGGRLGRCLFPGLSTRHACCGVARRSERIRGSVEPADAARGPAGNAVTGGRGRDEAQVCMGRCQEGFLLLSSLACRSCLEHTVC